MLDLLGSGSGAGGATVGVKTGLGGSGGCGVGSGAMDAGVGDERVLLLCAWYSLLRFAGGDIGSCAR